MRTKTVALGMICFCVVGHAQLKFEVASVKPSSPEAPGMFSRYLPGGGVRITGATLQILISMAHGVYTFQIAGGPKWIDTDRFDIDARLTTSDDTPPTNAGLTAEDQRKAAEGLRSLLADRFQLTLHPETREQSIFALVVAKGGPKIQETTETGSLIRRMGRGSIKGQAVGLRLLVVNLANELGRPVVDKTGLAAKYSFELKWNDEPDGTSIYAALQEQLGLRLESQKGPVKVLVVDRAEKPPAN